MEIRFFDTRDVSCELGREMGWTLASSVEDLFRGSDAVTVHVSARSVAGTSNASLLRRRAQGLYLLLDSDDRAV